jgi:hypothetical protein
VRETRWGTQWKRRCGGHSERDTVGDTVEETVRGTQ